MRPSVLMLIQLVPHFQGRNTEQTHVQQGNQRWQIPRPPHASAWQRSPH